MVDFNEEVVVIHFLALERVVRFTHNEMCRPSPGNKVSDAAVLVPAQWRLRVRS